MNFVINRSKEIAGTSPFKLKIIPNASKYKISKSMVKYLKNLTGIDVFDEKNLEKYIPIIKNLEETTKKILKYETINYMPIIILKFVLLPRHYVYNSNFGVFYLT